MQTLVTFSGNSFELVMPRPESDAETEKPNEKSDLEFFDPKNDSIYLIPAEEKPIKLIMDPPPFTLETNPDNPFEIEIKENPLFEII